MAAAHDAGDEPVAVSPPPRHSPRPAHTPRVFVIDPRHLATNSPSPYGTSPVPPPHPPSPLGLPARREIPQPPDRCDRLGTRRRPSVISCRSPSESANPSKATEVPSARRWRVGTMITRGSSQRCAPRSLSLGNGSRARTASTGGPEGLPVPGRSRTRGAHLGAGTPAARFARYAGPDGSGRAPDDERVEGRHGACRHGLPGGARERLRPGQEAPARLGEVAALFRALEQACDLASFEALDLARRGFRRVSRRAVRPG